MVNSCMQLLDQVARVGFIVNGRLRFNLGKSTHQKAVLVERKMLSYSGLNSDFSIFFNDKIIVFNSFGATVIDKVYHQQTIRKKMKQFIIFNIEHKQIFITFSDCFTYYTGWISIFSYFRLNYTKMSHSYRLIKNC